MLNYSNQQTISVFDSATLTGSFTGNEKEINVEGFSKLALDVDYERGGAEASSKLRFKIEHSTDGENWHSLVIDDTSTVSTITPRVWEVEDTSQVNILVDIAYKNIRISAEEADVSSNDGTVTMTATLSGL